MQLDYCKNIPEPVTITVAVSSKHFTWVVGGDERVLGVAPYPEGGKREDDVELTIYLREGRKRKSNLYFTQSQKENLNVLLAFYFCFSFMLLTYLDFR